MNENEKSKVVDQLNKAVLQTKAQYVSVMESIKEINKIAESLNHKIDWDKAEVSKKTIVKLLNEK